MRIRLLIIMMLPLLLIECQTSVWTMLTRRDSKLFSETEKIMFSETTASIDFKYGFDPDLDIDYVYKAGSFTDKEITGKAPEMKKVLLKYKTEEVIAFYEKIVQLRETQAWRMNYFIEKKRWTDSTYIQKYTLPEAEQYLEILEKNVIQINPAYAAEMEKRKDEIKKSVAVKLLQEIEERERRLNEKH